MESCPPTKKHIIARPVLLEGLEQRRLLSVGDDLGLPFLFLDDLPGSASAVDVGGGVKQLDISVTANYVIDQSGGEGPLSPEAILEISLLVNSDGTLNGGVVDSDMRLYRDNDDSNTFTAGDDVLLTGEIRPTNSFFVLGETLEFIFDVDAVGEWATDPLYFLSGSGVLDVGVQLSLSGGAIDFVNGFTDLSPKGVMGSLPNEQGPPAVVDIEKYVKGVEETPGGEGLTPGFWKQPHHFDAWVGYAPTDSYNTVFGVNDPDSPTLLGALERGGGGYNALGRHAVAALLNASNPDVDYAFATAQIIAMVQQAYATNNFEPTKDQLAKENEKGAELGDGPLILTPTPGFGDDADDPPGPTFPVGSQVMFTYVVTNPGPTPLTNVVVVDDNETPGSPGDDFSPTPVLAPSTTFNIGDDNQDGNLDPGEVWLYTWTKIVTAGQHTNIGQVTATPTDQQPAVTDSDPANWNGGTQNPVGAIDIEKYVKQKSTTPAGGEGLTPGFWKQPQHFSFWTGYTPTDSYNTVFGVNDPDSPTLLGALSRGGGGRKALGRHAVAALLNAAHANVDYAYTTAQVIAMVQQAYASGDFETPKNLLAKENEKGANLSDGNNNTPSTGFGIDADTAPGLTVLVGSQVTFTYVVTNPGQAPLSNVVVVDDNETPGDTADDFNPTPVLFSNTTFNIGDDDQDGKLDPGEVWLYTATKSVTGGQHTNIGKSTAVPVDAGGNVIGAAVSDSDAANWLGEYSPMYGKTATVSFWANKNGQTLIKYFNVNDTKKAGSSTALGNWLATNFPKIYGVRNTPNYFSGKNTSHIASRFLQLAAMASPQADAQTLAAALNIYATTMELNSTAFGRLYAWQRGFILSNQSSSSNLRNTTWNVGSNGEAFAATSGTTLVSADNQSLSVWTLLQRANSFAVNGVLWSAAKTIGGTSYSAATLKSQGAAVFSGLCGSGETVF